MKWCEQKSVIALTGLLLIWLITPSLSKSLEELRVQLRGTDLIAKYYAIDELQKISERTPAAKQLLIDELKEEIALENQRIKEGRGDTGEAKGEVFSHLLSVVADFRDPSTLNVLADSLDTGVSVKSAQDTFLHFADTATLCLIGKLDVPNLSEYKKTEAVSVLVLIAKNGKLTEKTRQLLRKAFLNYLKENSWSIRKEATTGLGALGSTNDIEALQGVARTDQYSRKIDASFRGGRKGEKIAIYPVREEAEKAIKKLKIKKDGAREQEKD